MTTLKQDFEFHVGESVVLDFSVTEDSAAKDVTSSAITWRLGATLATVSADMLQMSVGSGITITSGAGGLFRVAVPPADTSGLAARAYVHQAIVTFFNADVAVVSEGEATVFGILPAT